MSKFSVLESIPGVVVDEAAGLMWSAEDVTPKSVEHKAAEEACSKLDLAGFTDWRLPTVEELFLLADRSKFSPAIDTEFFPTCKSDWYWTSSADASAPADYAWFVLFDSGLASVDGRDYRCCVRAVRSSRASQ